ncbi:MAG TPA: FtsW/RodA/SpoVE family cell cycle protein [Vicinamibacterales bacterium]
MTGAVSTPASRASRATREALSRLANLELALLTLAIGLLLIGAEAAWLGRLPDIADARTAIAQGRVADLSVRAPATRLVPLLTTIDDPRERLFIAQRIEAALTGSESQAPLKLDHVGDLSALRVETSAIDARRDLPGLRARLNRLRAGRFNPPAIRLLETADLRALRAGVVVRSGRTFAWRLAIWTVVLAAAFAAAHAIRRAGRAGGDPLLLPIVAVLCSIGFLTMVAVNDPLRDRLLFEQFAGGAAIGCLFLAGASLLDFRRLELHRFAFVFLAAALLLSLLLLLFGWGPAGSGVKVNLLGVQPVEAIRPLVALFLAGYFARRWEMLRELREPRAASHPILRRFRVPRLADVVPVAAGMLLVLLFFFFQRDLGPALVLACVFLITYSVARGRWGLAAAGLAVLIGGFAAGYALGYPSTVVRRVEIWRAPWDNAVTGGDQIAHALWALASGGASGQGVGSGGAELIPTGENDLVLASVGETLGFAGVLAVLLLFALFIIRTLRVARRTDEPYFALLVVGLVASLTTQLLLIGGGMMGLLPLSGVVTPFLSLGRSSMISNLAVVGLLLAASRQASWGEQGMFARPVRVVSAAFVALLAVLGIRAFTVQVLWRDETMGRQVRTRQADGAVRAQENPRLRAAADLLVRGKITDRNGIPLAFDGGPESLTPDERRMLEAAGAILKAACPQPRARCYPFGGATFHLLGDAATRANWGAPNTSFVERELDARLRGYSSYAELVPLWDHRRNLNHRDARRVIERPRDVKVSIDARLQSRAAALLTSRLERLNLSRGAIAVLDATSGDVLASVNAPWPSVRDGRIRQEDAVDRADLPLLDRVRYGQYPPGSTFKLVTAAAALRSPKPVAAEHFVCRRLPDGRVGAQIPGWRRPIRDDVTDTVPHGDVTLDEGIRVSCNAFFAQLGLAIGARTLKETANLFDIQTAKPDTAERLRGLLPWASHGQGEVVASPFRMARVAATFAAGGVLPEGRWILSPAEEAVSGRRVIDQAAANRIARAMRTVVTAGTARALVGTPAEIAAGKTGTAEVANAPSHSWFIGYAPAEGAGRKIALAVIVENGGYGARAAVPLAGDIIAAARQLEIIP